MKRQADQDDARRGSGPLGRAHAAADRLYQAAVRPDRPLEPETGKKPWLAALLSLLIVGAGQLYNRQLAKALLLFAIFYLAGGAILLLYTFLNWTLQLGARLPEVALAGGMVWGALWLFAGIDAYRIAAALRDGRLVVRYGFLRQGAHVAAGFIPVVGMAVPPETIRPGEVNRPVAEAVKEIAKERLTEWLVVRALRIACPALGLLLIIAGAAAGIRPLILTGGLLIAGGIMLFLV